MTVTDNDRSQSDLAVAPDPTVVAPRSADRKAPPQGPDSQRPKKSAAQPPAKRHITALDGMRGVAVLLVLCFHFRLGPFRGGFVGVTVFFTLSGFLICSRTLTEVGRSGRFGVTDFFERRIRRLAPAAILCILAVVVFTEILGTREQRTSVPGDAVASLANVANWRFLIHGTSYTDLFAAPSPLNHFWSLAIEEQFYLLFPLVVWLVLKLPRRLRVVSIAVIVSVGLEWSAHAASTADSFNRFYYGTDDRMAELLIGVILALGLSYWHVSVPRRAGRQRFAVTLLAVAGLAFIVVGATTYRNGGSAYQHGGAFLIALATGALILGALEGSNGVAKLCSVAPLVWVGKVSYGAYLYHWPIYALSGGHWGPLHGTALGLAQLALSLLLAGLSFRFLEQPLQRRKLLPTRRKLLYRWAQALAGVAVLALLLGAVVPTPGVSRFANNPSGLQIPPAAKIKPTAVVPRTNAADRPLRVLVTGDSTARVIANALIGYQNAHPKALQVLDLSLPGCPITPVDRIRNYSGEQGQNVTLCGGWRKTFGPQIAAFKPDVSAVFLSVMETTDQRTLSTGWDNLLDPAYRTHQESEFSAFAKLLSATGAPVVWANAPFFKFQPDLPWVSDNPERTVMLNKVYTQLAATDSNVHLINYAAQLNRPGGVVDTKIRPDGIHMNDVAAAKLSDTWLLPMLDAYKPKPEKGSKGAQPSPAPTPHS